MINVVELAESVIKNFHEVPAPIKKKLFTWVAAVEERGLIQVRKIPGYHDEPLKGDRVGQRSIRLNKKWRATYRIVHRKVEFVLIQEVTPHDY